MGAFFMALLIFMHWRYVKHDVSWFQFQDEPQTVHGKWAYVITRSYGGQMTRAIRNMLVQQCWAGFLKEDVVITEPFSIESKLVHEPKIWNILEKGQLHTAARFGDYYNLTYYNEQSMKHGSAQLIRWETFLASAPRKAVAVRMPTQSCNGIMVEWECSFSNAFKRFVDTLTYMGFNVVRKMCLVCSSQPHGLGDLSELLFNSSGNISVIMDTWRNYGFTSNWMDIPEYCKMAEQPQTSNSFLATSDLILKQASLYMDRFIQRKNYVGIMLRIERFLTVAASGRSHDSVQSCLNKCLSLLEKIRSKNFGVYVTVDIGKFGSGVMQNKGAVSRYEEGTIAAITESVESLFKHLYNTTVSLKSWEETFVNVTDGKTERGYIAMVQRNIAYQADCLILMGGGSFQQVAGFQYLENAESNNRKPCIHTVCTLESFSKLFKT